MFHGFHGSQNDRPQPGRRTAKTEAPKQKLKPRKGDEPHWHRLRAGCYLGYRPTRKTGPGTWFARAYDPDTNKYARKALGDYGTLPGNDTFAHAKKDAEAWAERVESGGVQKEKVEAVADACRAYLKEKPGSIAEGVFRRHVYADPIAKVKIDKLRRHHLQAWRKRLEDAPALLTRNKDGEKRTKVRSPSTVNRDMAPVRAALGRMLTPGAPNTDAAWQEALRPAKGADRRRDLYLDRTERKRLIDAADVDVQPFIRAMCLLPLRPGALASLTVGDFDKRTKTLTIGKDKNGKPRQIAMPANIVTFLTAQTTGKLPSASIFMRGDGRNWSKDAWKGPIKTAVTAAKLEENSNSLIDKIAKAWARVAKDTNSVIILVHHTSKAGAGEVTALSARGAVALINACSATLVLNRMDKERAEQLGISDDDRRRYFSVEDDKHNRAPAEKADWYHLASVDLNNGDGDHPGDSVGVAEPWQIPDPFDNVTAQHLLLVQQAIDRGDFREDAQAKTWAGNAVAIVLGHICCWRR